MVEGSVRKSDQHVRIAAQLTEVGSGTHVWAERYDLELTELFAIQDEIAERVAGALEPELGKTELVLAAARHTGNMTAWDLVRRGTWHFHQVTRENHFNARELFRQACKLDPELPEAYLWVGRANAGMVAYGWCEAWPTTSKRARRRRSRPFGSTRKIRTHITRSPSSAPTETLLIARSPPPSEQSN